MTPKKDKIAVGMVNPVFVKESDISNEIKARNSNNAETGTMTKKPPPAGAKPVVKEKPDTLRVKPVTERLEVNDGAQGSATPSDEEEELEIEGDVTPQTLRKRGPKENIYSNMSNKPAKKRVIPLASLAKVISEKKQKGEFKAEYKVKVILRL